MSNFIAMCINGEALMQEIDDFVDSWHEEDSKLSLSQYLGMSKLEYNLWVADSALLPYIITAHKNNQKISEIVDSIAELPLAARASSPESAIRLYEWLKKERLLED